LRQPPAAAPGRGARRRLETRAKLLGAARDVMARKGIGSTSIQEITDAADVGFGSFYNHFDSKEAIVEAVLEEAIESFGDAADHLAEGLEDPAEAISSSIRHAVNRAAADEAWGWFVVRTALARAGSLRRGLGRRLARDIQAGIDAGRFKVADPQAAVAAAGGATLAIIAARLHGEFDGDAAERTAAVVLALLGLPAKEAGRIARRPLPPLGEPRQSGGSFAGREESRPTAGARSARRPAKRKQGSMET
jgi:AcrR family transcriptional regulator